MNYKLLATKVALHMKTNTIKSICCLFLQICAAQWKWCINKDTFITNLGDWCLTGTGLQADAPSNKYHFVSRASDYMLTHFQLFSEVSCFSVASCPTADLLSNTDSAATCCGSFANTVQPFWPILTNRQTDTHIFSQSDRQADRWNKTDRQTVRWTD